MDMPALFAIAAPGRGAGAAKVEHCVRYVHRRWLAYHAGALRMESTDDNLLRWTAPPVGGWPAVAHPLAPLVDAWQLWKKANDTTAPPDAKTRTAGGLIRLPYAATETVRRAWRPAAEVAAVEVDGEPLTARLLDARPDCAQDWLYVDGPDAGLDERGNLSLPDRSQLQPVPTTRPRYADNDGRAAHARRHGRAQRATRRRADRPDRRLRRDPPGGVE